MLATSLEIEVATLLIGFLLAIGYLATTRQIKIEGFLSTSADVAQLSMGRIQLLIFVLAVSGTYVGQLMENPHRFPAIPSAILLTYAGSNATYVGAKAGPLIRSFLYGGSK